MSEMRTKATPSSSATTTHSLETTDSTTGTKETNTLACLACRKRKVRCDLALPPGASTTGKTCSNCAKSGSECIIPQGKTRPGPPSGLLSQVSEDVVGIQDTLAAMQTVLSRIEEGHGTLLASTRTPAASSSRSSTAESTAETSHAASPAFRASVLPPSALDYLAQHGLESLPSAVVPLWSHPEESIYAFFGGGGGSASLLVNRDDILSLSFATLRKDHAPLFIVMALIGGLRRDYERSVFLPCADGYGAKLMLHQFDLNLADTVQALAGYLQQEEAKVNALAKSQSGPQDGDTIQEQCRQIVVAALLLVELILAKHPTLARRLLRWVHDLPRRWQDDAKPSASFSGALPIDPWTHWCFGSSWSPLFWQIALFERSLHLLDGSEHLEILIDWHSRTQHDASSQPQLSGTSSSTQRHIELVRLVDDCLAAISNLETFRYLSTYIAALSRLEERIQAQLSSIPRKCVSPCDGDIGILNEAVLLRQLLIELYIPLLPAARQVSTRQRPELTSQLSSQLLKTPRAITDASKEILELVAADVISCMWPLQCCLVVAALQVVKHAAEKQSTDSEEALARLAAAEDHLQHFNGGLARWIERATRMPHAITRQSSFSFATNNRSGSMSPLTWKTPSPALELTNGLCVGESWRQRSRHRSDLRVSHSSGNGSPETTLSIGEPCHKRKRQRSLEETSVAAQTTDLEQPPSNIWDIPPPSLVPTSCLDQAISAHQPSLCQGTMMNSPLTGLGVSGNHTDTNHSLYSFDQCTEAPLMPVELMDVEARDFFESFTRGEDLSQNRNCATVAPIG